MPGIRTAIGQKLRYLQPDFLNATSTVRTSMGFMGTFVERWLPQRFRSTQLTSIFNYLPITDALITAGQPTEAQLAAVKAAGFSRVINLAPHGMENSLANEAGTVAGLGMDYVHIPVDFKNPTDADFAQFCAALQQAQSQKVLVHCAANMRVSAFVFRYRTQVLGEAKTQAEKDLHRIWKPFGVWADFVDRAV
ncbi:MAG TPA: protein tyrosine phosphatase family protein [Dongiaceae bacterium]|nr:protein tyrosine phosphatase family protein [Dongiaceae bacterium]